MVDRNGVLIIRVWLEDGMNAFRGRLTTFEPDGAAEGTEDHTYAVVSSPSDVLNAVREWLGSFEQRAAERIDSQ